MYRYALNKLVRFCYNDIKFIYERNILGDIIRIYNSETGEIVGEYAYDGYGNHSIIKNVDGIATLNPFRYRGYYFDNESNLFYLNSRYYDPEVGRFISLDIISILDETRGQINGLNLYMYCADNPISYIDPSGHLALLLIFSSIMYLGLMGATSSIAIQAISDISTGNKFDIVNYLIAGVAGFIGGGLSYFSPYSGAIVQGVLSTGLSMAYAQYKGKANYDWSDYAIAIFSSGVLSLLTTLGFNKLVNKTNAFDTARIFGDNLKKWFDCGNKVFLEMLGDLTPYYLAYSLVNSSSGLIGGWIPEYIRKVIGLKKLGLSWEDSLKDAF